jgi:hypothetical protein
MTELLCKILAERCFLQEKLFFALISRYEMPCQLVVVRADISNYEEQAKFGSVTRSVS